MRGPTPPGVDPGAPLATHLFGCAACRAFASSIGQVDVLVRQALVVEPPVELRSRLMAVIQEVAVPAPVVRPSALVVAPGPAREARRSWSRPLLAAGMALMGTAVSIALWQLVGVLVSLRPVLGNVPYALDLVAASPAPQLLTDLLVNAGTVSLWVLAGLTCWLLFYWEAPPPGRRAGWR
ncbi:MAG: hypothetical protein ACYDAG_10420 [Chloroflexota bacterium]